MPHETMYLAITGIIDPWVSQLLALVQSLWDWQQEAIEITDGLGREWKQNRMGMNHWEWKGL